MEESSFTRNFAMMADYRQHGKIKHILYEVIFIAVAGFIAKCDNWKDLHVWAQIRIDWFKSILRLPYGLPSVVTFRRIFRMINPKQFEKCFVSWTREIAGEKSERNVAIDGKTLCGAKESAGEKSPIHIVSAWADDNGLSMGEVKTNEKSNEITAIPELLKLLSIEGCTVTIDAAGTQTEIAKRIVEENKAEYVLALKENQPSMYSDVVLATLGIDVSVKLDKEAEVARQQEAHEMAAKIECVCSKALSTGNDPLAAVRGINPNVSFDELNPKFHRTVGKGHGRIETRLYITFDAGRWLNRYDEWSKLTSIGVVLSKTTAIKSGKCSTDYRFYLLSFSDVVHFAKSVRSHWGIESMHWVLDVTWGEDASRIRKDNEPENVAVLRKIAYNLIGIERNLIAIAENKPYKETYSALCTAAMASEEFLEKVMIENIR